MSALGTGLYPADTGNKAMADAVDLDTNLGEKP